MTRPTIRRPTRRAIGRTHAEGPAEDDGWDDEIGAKVANSVMGPETTIVSLARVPEYAPVPDPVQLTNW
jgi:hypothetical protein